MSIVNAAVLVALASPSSSDKVETYKTALSKKIEELKARFQKQFEDRFSQIIRSAQTGTDHNQLRYEAKTLLIDLLDLSEGRQERSSYKFEPKPSIDTENFTQKVKEVKTSILNDLLERLEKFKKDVKNCRSEREILELVGRIKNFKSRFKKILQKERRLPSTLEKSNIPLGKSADDIELVPLIGTASPQAVDLAASSKALWKKVSAKLKKTYKRTPRLRKKRQKQFNRILKRIRKNQKLFADFLDPKNRAAVIETVLCALEDKAVSSKINPQELLKFLKAKSYDAYDKTSGEIQDKFSAFFFPLEAEKVIKKRDEEFAPLKERFYAVRNFAQSQYKDNFVEILAEEDLTIEGFIKKMGTEFACMIPYRKVQANIRKFDDEENLAASFEILKTVLYKIAGDILSIPVREKQEKAVELLQRPFRETVNLKSQEDLSWAKTSLSFFYEKVFKNIKGILEAKIKAYEESKAKELRKIRKELFRDK